MVFSFWAKVGLKLNYLLCTMPRIIAIDYGTKRCGIAVTDNLQITANPLDTLHPEQLFDFFTTYFQENEVSTLVVGAPFRMSGEASKVESEIVGFIRKFKKQYPEIQVEREDERFTSKMASQTIASLGIPKNKRKDKSLVDKMSATLILQSFLNRI